MVLFIALASMPLPFLGMTKTFCIQEEVLSLESNIQCINTHHSLCSEQIWTSAQGNE